jgi:RNA polymerase sigma-70 factor (ECF subfamily)
MQPSPTLTEDLIGPKIKLNTFRWSTVRAYEEQERGCKMSIAVNAWLRCNDEGEKTLHERTKERDEEFAGLVRRQSCLMFRVAYGVLRNSHDAEDAVQESFLKLYRGEAWRVIEDEKAFLARTVWRVALDRIASRPSHTNDIADYELLSPMKSPEEDAIEGDQSELLRYLISKLPSEMRGVLALSALEEMNSVEVGLVLEIPEGTVRTRLVKAKAELKKRFEAMTGVRR